MKTGRNDFVKQKVPDEAKVYDVAIVGAGINGCALAYELHKRGQSVLVLEKDEIASGGSGAAGAFINPKISKSGPLKELIQEAYLYSLDFYNKYFTQFTTSAPLLHISKYSDDNEKVDYFKRHTSLRTSKIPKELHNRLKPYALAFASVFLEDNAVVEAKEICIQMLKGVDFVKMKVQEPCFKDDLWQIQEYQSKKLVLCTGAYDEVLKEPYIELRRIYGQRCEVYSSTHMNATVHHEVSVSATKKNGRIAIGASHYLDEASVPSEEEGASALLELANKSVLLEDVKIHNTFTGMRSGSNDYLPLLGPIVNTNESLQEDKRALKGDKSARVSYVKNAYMINGVGGYGFVLAPYLAKLMADLFIDNKFLPALLEPKRFYYRYAKKRGQNL